MDAFLDHADAYKLDTVESEITQLFKQFSNFRTNNGDMLTQRNAAIEEKYVAYAASIHLRGQQAGDRASNREILQGFPGSADEGRGLLGIGFSTLAGVILQSDQERFARTMFRATRGNAFTEFHQIPEPFWDPSNSSRTLKSVFVIFFQGGQNSAMSQKISRIAQSFSANIYAWPSSETAAIEQMNQADQFMEDKRRALMAYDKFLSDESEYLFKPVRSGCPNSLIDEWRMFCTKEKAIYATLNLFEGDVTLRADCWFPADQEDRIKALLSFGQSATTTVSSPSSSMAAMLLVDYHQTKTTAPTYIKTNDVTRSFQLIVDTYGVPRYKEANPALFSVVTFPFLFGVMFGDVGHGFLLLTIGIYTMMKKEEETNSSSFLSALFPHRYMITAMGFFSIYAGLMYSEFFAIPLNLFGSRWSCPAVHGQSTTECEPLNGSTYPFGIDPAWSVASNSLLFVNSLKMKVSVLFGVCQMLLGIYLKFTNSLFFRNVTDLVFECIPQLAFMLAFFGYMDYLIMYKWVTPLANPPGLIDTMIGMGLNGGGVREGAEMFSNQEILQGILFKIGLISVPLMLIPKPIILWAQHSWNSRHSSGGGSSVTHQEDDRTSLITTASSGGPQKSSHSTHGDEFEFGEIAIHQAIETIEYVLGTVSHTASYLRLWALSLAHQQLSLVFLQKTVYSAMTSSVPMILNAIPIFIAFAQFFGVTVGILLGMDVMECFLHTLRLHWVEFQSKFYKADGIAFSPYTHKKVLEDEVMIANSAGGSM